MIPPCKTCGPSVDCVDVYPPDIYSLEGPKFGFVLECPPGEDCTGVGVVNIVCCGQIIQIQIPNGASDDDKTAIINDGMRRCVIANFFCGGGTGLPPDQPPLVPPFVPPGPPGPPPPPPPPIKMYYSHDVLLTSTCPDGSTFHFFLKPGYFLTDNQAFSDRLALAYATQQIKHYQFCLDVPTMCGCTDTPSVFTIRINGGKGPFTANPISGHVPDGMTVNCSGTTITISGTPTTPGAYQFVLNAGDTHFNYIQKTVTIHVINIGYGAALTLGFLSPSVAGTVTSAIASADYALNDILHMARQVSGINTQELGTFQITGVDVPMPGLVELTNLTATPGVNYFAGDVAYWDLDTPLPDLTVGNPYSFQLPATGGSGSYTWTESGALPDGLTMDASGLISGTPTSNDSKTFTVTVSDDAC